MARPTKQNLSYFALDVDFFDNVKVRKIMKACGSASPSILICLLCSIYRTRGYYILWDEDMAFDVADRIGTSEGAVQEVVNKAVQVNFFHRPLFDSKKILTSPEIQHRYKRVCLDAKRVDWKIEEFIDLTNGETPFPPVETGFPPEETIQRKEEKSKEKKSRVGEADKPPAPAPKKNFISPTPAEVTDFFKEKIFEKEMGWPLQKIEETAAKFISHYTANGWKVGKNPMKDWRAAICSNWLTKPPDYASNRSNSGTAGAGTSKAERVTNGQQALARRLSHHAGHQPGGETPG